MLSLTWHGETKTKSDHTHQTGRTSKSQPPWHPPSSQQIWIVTKITHPSLARSEVRQLCKGSCACLSVSSSPPNAESLRSGEGKWQTFNPPRSEMICVQSNTGSVSRATMGKLLKDNKQTSRHHERGLGMKESWRPFMREQSDLTWSSVPLPGPHQPRQTCKPWTGCRSRHWGWSLGQWRQL